MSLNAQNTRPLSAPSESGVALLEMGDLEKRYGGVRALSGASVKISRRGVVHALLGENGSGKSTTLGILSGQIRPDGGRILLNGLPMSFATPTDAVRQGIGMVSQESAVALDLSIAENILMGRRLVRSAGRINWNRTRIMAEELMSRLGVDLDVRRSVRSLRPDERQIVEIARAISLDPLVLILDEPTSSLTEDEVGNVLDVIRTLKSTDMAVLFVSHRLREVMQIADEVTVLREGVDVARGSISDFHPRSIIHHMVGREPFTGTGERHSDSPQDLAKPVALEVIGLSARDGSVNNVTLSVRAGEIVGLSGPLGAGRGELLETIFGARRTDTGTVRVQGQPVKPSRPKAAIDARVGYVPPDRKAQGVILPLSVRENVSVVADRNRSRWSRPRRPREDALVAKLEAEMRLKPGRASLPVGTLSGGNQQKVALGKWLVSDTAVLMLDEPTRGVDVAAKAEIHDLLVQAAQRGMALLVSSSENQDLIDLCDRIVVMAQGGVAAERRASDVTEADLLHLVGGE